MDPMKTGSLIRVLRRKRALTQLELAERIHVSDKAVSKWERGRGAPDLALLPALAEALGTDVDALLNGEWKENDMSNGNLKKLSCYACPDCGNLVFATDQADIRCCGTKRQPLEAKKAEDGEKLSLELIDNEWYVTSSHEMTREHYISYVALVTGDSLTLKKLYPEWGLEARFPRQRHGRLLWYCTRHGLFCQDF